MILLFTSETQTLGDALLALFNDYLVVASRWHISDSDEARSRGGFLSFGCSLFNLLIACEASVLGLEGLQVIIKFRCFLHLGSFCRRSPVLVYFLNLPCDKSGNAILVVLDFGDLICQFCLG